ncbi:hypothetical protein GCM10010197_40190 [Nocardioides luteus]|uniref:Uncharacterized protein n=1 Tax=Nocardioides luteus TaxID=1844 RepID=A0ABQ5SWF1_9ACTN|nr:hypothetical protein GCM10010197_40190 [Nocardioides luteus]GLJ68171.1 hypothetical protein GCM10017579_22070 [Nocardioides luteus]
MASIGAGGTRSCPEHGVVPPLWRTDLPSYDDLVTLLEHAGEVPTYVPWPLEPGWSITDLAVVGEEGKGVATLLTLSGTTPDDGAVEMTVVTEEAGVGLGARCARTEGPDPGIDACSGPPTTKVRVGGQLAPLWPVTQWTNGAEEWERSVVVGEAAGRWLWLVFRPATAMLMLQDGWQLRQVSDLGVQMVELPFGGPGGSWWGAP